MQMGPSVLSMAAASLYSIVLVTCIATLFLAPKPEQAAWHRVAWLGLAGLFAILAWLRWLNAESMIRDELRLVLQAVGWQNDRRVLQSAIVLAFLIACTLLGLKFRRMLFRLIRSRRDFVTLLATLCGAFMAALLILRLISLHAIDVLLFGPLKLNWVGDIGASLTVLVCAAVYILISPTRRRVRQRR